MKRGRSSLLPVLRLLSLLALGGVWAVACGGPQQPGAAGSVCFRTDDCKDGLACVPTAVGSSMSVCSANLTGIVSMVDGAPVEAAAPATDASAGSGGASAAGTGGMTVVAGAAGKAATGGATGAAGSGSAGKSNGGAPSGGAPSGGAPAAGAPAGGAPAGGSGTAGSGTAGSATSGSGGTGGSLPVDAGDG